MTDDKPLQRRLFRFSMAVLLNIQGNLPAQRAKSANMVGQLPARSMLRFFAVKGSQIPLHSGNGRAAKNALKPNRCSDKTRCATRGYFYLRSDFAGLR